MLRYIKEAFWAPANLPLIGSLPVNALLVLGAGIFGFAEHAVWLIGAGLETGYLYLLATNPRFQRVIAARDIQQVQTQVEIGRRDLLKELTPDARARLEKLEGKVRRIGEIYRTVAAGESSDQTGLLFESDYDALQKLCELALRLLVAERRLIAVRQQTDDGQLARQRDDLRTELSEASLSVSLRASKQATLELVEKRLANSRRRAENLAEIDSDLARIEAQIDLSLESAGIQGGQPSGVSENLSLLNRILESNRSLSGFDGAPLETGDRLSAPQQVGAVENPPGRELRQ